MPRVSGIDNGLASPVNVQQAVVIDEFEGDDDECKGNWNLLRSYRPVSNVARNEQQGLFRRVSKSTR